MPVTVVGSGPNRLAAAIEMAQNGVHGMCGYHAARAAIAQANG